MIYAPQTRFVRMCNFVEEIQARGYIGGFCNAVAYYDFGQKYPETFGRIKREVEESRIEKLTKFLKLLMEQKTKSN